MAQATNRWPELIQHRQRLAPGADRASRKKITLSLRLAKWYAEDLGHPEYAQPYYQQVLRSTRTTWQVLRQMASFFKKPAPGSSRARRSPRALNVAVTDTDRKEILTELGEVLERAWARSIRASLLQARPRRGSAPPPRARGARAHLRRSQPVRRTSSEILGARRRRSPSPRQIARSSCAPAASTRPRSARPRRPAGLPRGARARRATCSPCAAWSASTPARKQWPDLVASSRCSSTWSRPSASASTCSSRSPRSRRSSSSSRISRPSAWSRSSRSTRATRSPSSPWSAATGACGSGTTSSTPSIGTSTRRTIARRRSSSTAQIAKVYADEVQDVDRAIDAYLNIVDLDDTNIPALEALSKLYEKQDDAAAPSST
jgi:hypothetical protein